MKMEGKFVRVSEPGMSMFSCFYWVGKVINGVVHLKPGFNTWHFTDDRPVKHYKNAPFGTAAAVRSIKEITGAEFDAAKTYPL
jgi:hypothetical protein